MNTILHPTDFTAESEQAFLLARGIARDQSAELIVLHVVSPDCCREEDRDEDGLAPDSPLFQSCWIRFDRLRSLAPDIPVAFQIKVGQVADSIVNVAQREACRLIVLAAHHSSFQHYQLHGSAIKGVVRRTPCPILCLRQSPFHQPAPGVLDGLERQLQNSELQAATPGRISTAARSAVEGEPHECLDSPDLMCDRLQSTGTESTEVREFPR